MKPPGIGMTVSNGSLHFATSRPTRTEDAIWEAVREAISEGWEPRQFIREAQSAWEGEIDDRKRVALKEFGDALAPKVV